MGMPGLEVQLSLYTKRTTELEAFASKTAARLEAIERSLDGMSSGAMETPLDDCSRRSAEQSVGLKEMIRKGKEWSAALARVMLFLQRGESGRAIEVLTSITRADPTDAITKAWIASLESRRGNAKVAVMWYCRAAATWVAKHNLCEAAGTYVEALKVDGILLEDRVVCTAGLGALYEHLDLPADALAVYRTALAIKPRPRSDAMRLIEQHTQRLEAQGVTVAPASSRQMVAAPASVLTSLIGVVSIGGDAVEDSEAIYDGDDHAEGADEPGVAASCAVPRSDIGFFRDHFQRAAGPRLDAPRDVLEGLARCEVILGNAGAALEAYVALIERSSGDPLPPARLEAIRAKIAALKKQE